MHKHGSVISLTSWLDFLAGCGTSSNSKIYAAISVPIETRFAWCDTTKWVPDTRAMEVGSTTDTVSQSRTVFKDIIAHTIHDEATVQR